eukprot:TRINITY_DN61577_c0_g1_i1.p1 TRINITY_DN61577_c0_g1~~TRINITY_DN61577_c0_g1_i1.p1  ORF type:complete len:499 (+),score=134.43 TRINITY_DN61577_c0_g1_i1:86-1582(+)
MAGTLGLGDGGGIDLRQEQSFNFGEMSPDAEGGGLFGGGEEPPLESELPPEDYTEGPQGIYSTLPITTRRGKTLEVEAQEGETLTIPPGRIGEVVTADWGTDRQVVQVTDFIRTQVVDGGLSVPATIEMLGDAPAGPDELRSLVVSFIDAHYVSPRNRLAGVDLSTPEGQRFALELDNERLTADNTRLKELLARAQAREIHYEDVDRRLQKEIAERVKLQQSVYENEGALVGVRVRHLEQENQRIRRQMDIERKTCLVEQQQRQRAEEELSALRDIRAGSPERMQSELELLRKECDRLHTQVRELSRLNCALQSTIRDQSDMERSRAAMFEEDCAQDLQGAGDGKWVRVRRAALCPHGRAQVELWEQRAAVRAGVQGAPVATIPSGSVAPSPQRGPSSARTTTLLGRSPASARLSGGSRPPVLPPATPPPLAARAGLGVSPLSPPGSGVGTPPAPGRPSAGSSDSGWREFRTPDGRPIFHNVRTATTQWQRPSEPLSP